MDFYQELFWLIDMRSFSNLWFWVALAVVWSSASHWVMGVPFDMVVRARRVGGQAEEDLETIVRVKVKRLMMIARVSGLWIMGMVSFVLTGLMLLGWVYRIEFAQAVFLLAFPMTIVGLTNLKLAQKIEHNPPKGEELRRVLSRHRLVTQMIGTLSIFVTAMWGMYQNIAITGPWALDG